MDNYDSTLVFPCQPYAGHQGHSASLSDDTFTLTTCLEDLQWNFPAGKELLCLWQMLGHVCNTNCLTSVPCAHLCGMLRDLAEGVFHLQDTHSYNLCECPLGHWQDSHGAL